MRFVALDLSLRSTGWARVDTSGLSPKVCGVIAVKSRGAPRLWEILRQVLEVTAGADIVAIEDYAYGQEQKKTRAFALGELGGVVKVGLLQQGIPFVLIPPTSAKKVATGNGNANKNAVFAAAIRRMSYDGVSEDETDALWVLEVLLQHYEAAGRLSLPQKHLEGLAKVKEWPELTVAT